MNESGKIELLTEIRLKKPQRALVTILDEEPKVSDESKKEKLIVAFKKAQKVKLFQDIKNPVECALFNRRVSAFCV